MDYTELLFAAEVHKLAREIRQNQLVSSLEKWRGDPASTEFYTDKFHKENPFEKFVEQAYRELQAAVQLIEKVKQADLKKVMSGQYAPMDPPKGAS